MSALRPPIIKLSAEAIQSGLEIKVTPPGATLLVNNCMYSCKYAISKPDCLNQCKEVQ